MTWDNFGLLREIHQASPDGVEELALIASGKICATDRPCEEGISGDEQTFRGEV